MRTLRFDSVGGASGDMILSALVDAGADLDALRKALATLHLAEPFELTKESAASHGMHGTRVRVHVHEHEHEHGHAPHRLLKDIRELIEAADLSDRTKALSLAVFHRLAEAEAHVHNTTPAAIHFHEVAGTDSIVDIVGTCAGLELLDVDEVVVGPLPLGCGLTTFSHGIMPVPVPATVELLKGHPVLQTDEQAELVTPTGAALLMTWEGLRTAHRRQARRAQTIVASGNGFGSRELAGRPNFLRATILETAETETPPTDLCLVLECNLDDMLPELIGALTVKLLSDGALDVFTTPVQMKKQRPGTLLTVLCREQDRADLIDTIFAESTTFGIRQCEVQRSVLDRRHVEVETPFGRVRVKVGAWKGRDTTQSPEYEDCKRRAEEHDVPVRTVYEAACRVLPK